jgi:diguanylate cyclase (GGDEF)-like protein
MPTSTAPLPCLLAVEDSRVIRLVLEQYLGARFRVLHAEDGEEAWRLLQDHPEIEVVVTDLEMPRLSGIGLLQRVRQSSLARIRSLPVLVATTATAVGERHLAFQSGASDFLTKPLDEIELQARVDVHHRLARTIRELEESRKLLAEQATTDSLTGLKNRRALLAHGEHLVALAKRQRHDLSLLLLDLDHFKEVNDTHGHAVGDQVLVAIGGILVGETRDTDIVGRIGGEEFAVLLPGAEPPGATILAERIRAAVRLASRVSNGATGATGAAAATVRLSVSIGVASLHADGCGDVGALLEVADRRLYGAKQRGRDRVCAQDGEPTV